MAGIDEVAALAGVSTATVSRTLSGNRHVTEATRQRVLSAAEQLGYVVSSSASSLATGRTRNVGVVTPRLNRWFYSSVVQGAESELLSHGYDLTLYNLAGGGSERSSVFEHFLMRQRVDAVMAIALELTDAETGRLHRMNKPLVGLGGPLPGVHTLSIDEVAIARLATEHLISLGHTAIGHIGANKEYENDFHVPTDRRRGHEAALAAAGIRVDPELFLTSDFTMQGGYDTAKRLLAGPGTSLTAVFAASDEMAIGAILAARDLGLAVPGDVSVIGIDDHYLAEFFGLSTVAQFPESQGRMAAKVLLEQLSPGARTDDALNVDLPYELVARSSTAQANPARRASG